jgi:hypothetical protein
MAQILYRPRQTGKTTELIEWLRKVGDDYLIIVPIFSMVGDLIHKFKIPRGNICTEDNVIFKEDVRRIGIDCFWWCKNPKALFDKCVARVGTSNVVCVLDGGTKDAPFNIVDRIY